MDNQEQHPVVGRLTRIPDASFLILIRSMLLVVSFTLVDISAGRMEERQKNEEDPPGRA